LKHTPAKDKVACTSETFTSSLLFWAAAATAAKAFLAPQHSQAACVTGSFAYTPRKCLRALSPAVGYRCCTCREWSHESELFKRNLVKHK
jgi:hypothetical protein